MPSQNTSSRFERVLDGFFAALGPAFALIIALGLVGLVGYPLVRCIMFDGHIDYCYVTTTEHQVPNQPNVILYYLRGFRPWCPDRLLAPNLPSLEAAQAEAERLSCPMK